MPLLHSLQVRNCSSFTFKLAFRLSEYLKQAPVIWTAQHAGTIHAQCAGTIHAQCAGTIHAIIDFATSAVGRTRLLKSPATLFTNA